MTVPVNPPPQELADLPFWLVWRLVYVEGQAKPRKVPYYVSGVPRNGAQTTDEDRGQLVTYARAIEALQASGGHYDGVGFALQPDANIVALDFDDCVAGGEIARHVEDLCSGTYTEFSPSGTGVRAFFQGTLMSRKDVDAKRGAFPIEVFGHNGFVTFTGKVTETCALFGWEQTLSWLTPAVLEMYRARGWDDAQAPGDISDMALMALEPTLQLTHAQIAEYLHKLAPDMGYEPWLHIGMAVHHETGGTEEGFQLWHRWSMGAANYANEADCRDRWRSFGNYRGGRITTFKSVIKQAKENELRVSFDAKTELQEKIKAADSEFFVRTKLCPEIARDARIDSLAREALAKVLQKELKRLGSEYPISECKRMLAAPRETVQTLDEDTPEWLAGYVWVNDADKFYHCARGLWSTQQSFNAAFNRYMPRADGAAATVLKNAAATALEDYRLPTVGRAMYLPWANSQGTGIFENDGISYVNLFRPASVPKAVGQLTPEGRLAVDTFMRHLRLVCSGREEIVAHIVDFMAFCVQNPGIKIRHAILIKGIEGDGKSLIGTTMSQVMGPSNVKQISPKVLGTDFSDWAHGACIGVLEEIRLAGHNRHDIYNALKPNITNDTIPVHPKGKAEINVQNTMNYIAFTNHNDALPLSDTDRRWMVIFTPFATREALVAALREMEPEGVDAYWNKLHAAIASHFASLRRWLLDHRVSPTFNPNGNAPMTQEKEQMQSASATPEEELVRELLAEGAAGVGRDILSATSLVDAAVLADSEVSLQTTTINRILTRLGWVKLPKRVKWQGRAHRVWVRGQVPSCVQDALEATCRAGEDGVASAVAGFEKVPESVDLF